MPILSFSSSSITTYQKTSVKNQNERSKPNLSAANRNLRFSGVLSHKGSGDIKKLINKWSFFNDAASKNKTSPYTLSGRKWSFITLTLPSIQMHSSKEIKRIALNSFLISISRTYPDVKYFWKAELQKNKNIHFHIIIDVFINYMDLRNIWNKSLEPLGYITAYKTKSEERYNNNFDQYLKDNHNKDFKKVHKAFDFGVKTNWSSPNTTDIHSLKKVNNPAAYISKYVAKKTSDLNILELEQTRGSESFGRIWGCSDTLRQLPDLKIDIETDDYTAVYRYFKDFIKQTYQGEYTTTFTFDFTPFRIIRTNLMDNFSNFAT